MHKHWNDVIVEHSILAIQNLSTQVIMSPYTYQLHVPHGQMGYSGHTIQPVTQHTPVAIGFCVIHNLSWLSIELHVPPTHTQSSLLWPEETNQTYSTGIRHDSHMLVWSAGLHYTCIPGTEAAAKKWRDLINIHESWLHIAPPPVLVSVPREHYAVLRRRANNSRVRIRTVRPKCLIN